MEILSTKGRSSGFKYVNVDKKETIVGRRSDDVMPKRELTWRTAMGQYATKCSLWIILLLASLLISFQVILCNLSDCWLD